MCNKDKILLAGAMTGLLIGAIVCNFIPKPEPYVIVNKDSSDRVGGRHDYLYYNELDQEIIDNSIKINLYEENPKVYVFSGSTVEFEGFRDKVSVIVYGGLIGYLCTGMILGIVYHKKSRKEEALT